MIDFIFGVIFAALLTGKYAWRASLACLVCLVIPLVTLENNSWVDNLLIAAVLGTICPYSKFKDSTKVILLAAASIQLLSLLSNVYFDFFYIDSQFLHFLAYFVYLIFTPAVIIINILLIIDLLRIEFELRATYFNLSDYRRINNY